MNISKKWGIKITSKNRKIVENWRTNGGLRTNAGYCLSSHFSQNETRGFWVFSLPKDYTEITFEEFEKYILNKQPDVPENYKYLTIFLKKLKIK